MVRKKIWAEIKYVKHHPTGWRGNGLMPNPLKIEEFILKKLFCNYKMKWKIQILERHTCKYWLTVIEISSSFSSNTSSESHTADKLY